MKKAIISIFISLLALGLIACGSKAEPANSSADAGKTDIIEVTTAKAISRELPVFFEATGSLAADGQSDVAPIVSGRVIEVNFDVGSYVTKGDVLVRLDDRDSRIRLEQAQRQVEQGNAQIEQAKTAVKQSEAGVEQAKASLRQAQIRLGLKEGSNFDIEAFSQVRSTKAQLALAEKELKRAERLLATGDISKSLYDQRLGMRDQLLGQMEEARSNAAVAIKAINTAESAVNSAKTQVNSAKANVENIIRAVETSKVQIDQAKKAIADAVIYAPISGFVSERVADLGEFVNPSAPNTKICSIVRTAVLRMKIDVPEQNIGQVKEGQGVSINVSSYPDRNFAGTITSVYPNLNPQSRTLTVEAEVENIGGMLKPNQFATVRIAQSDAEAAIMLPKEAVRNDGGVNKVFVIENGRAAEKLIQTGAEEGGMIQAKTGLKEGEAVAVSNVALLYDGVSVKE